MTHPLKQIWDDVLKTSYSNKTSRSRIGTNLKSALFSMTILALAMTTGQVSWAKSSAHPDKVLNLAFEAPDDGFDTVSYTHL